MAYTRYGYAVARKNDNALAATELVDLTVICNDLAPPLLVIGFMGACD